MIKEQRVAFSGKIAVDEKWIKVGNCWWYLFAAVDCLTGYPLYTAIYPSNNGHYCTLFLAKLKFLGYYPKLIITDGWDAYIKSIEIVFPKAEHSLCQFHLLRSVYIRARKAKIFDTKFSTSLGKVFRTLYKRTTHRRVENLKKLLEPSLVDTVLSGLFNKLPKTIKAVDSTQRPTTANSVERFFGKFDHFYRSKGPFCDMESANKHLNLFLLGHLFAIKANGKPCPLESNGYNVSNIPFYHLFNQPNLLALKQRISSQYKEAA